MSGSYYASREPDGYNFPMSDERESVAEELRRIRDAVRERALLGDPDSLPDAQPVERSGIEPAEPVPAEEPAPVRPDLGPVNNAWETSVASTRGGAVGRFVRRLLAPLFDAQTAFNSRQVQLDNALLAYLDERIEGTRRHYDRVLEANQRHMADIDTRHLILQEELVVQVHDLVARIDLVLAGAEKNRRSMESALRDVRARLTRLEERLSRS